MLDFGIKLVFFVLLALVFSLIAYVVTSVREPVSAGLSLHRQPVGTVGREEAELSIGRLARGAKNLCTCAVAASVVGFVVVGVELALVLPHLGVVDGRLAVPASGDASVDGLGASMASGLFSGMGGGLPVFELVSLGMSVYLFWLLRRFFGRIGQSGRPFEVERAQELGRAGMFLLFMGIVPSLVNGAVLQVLGLALGFSPAGQSLSGTVLGGGAVPTLLLGVIVCVFARIFEYGCILQREDDGLV